VLRGYAARHPQLPLRIVIASGAGISTAVNAGIAASRGEVIVRMDAHAHPAPDYVRRAVAALSETDAGVVGGLWRIAPSAQSVVARAIARAVSHPLGAGDATYRIGHRLHARTAVDTVPFGCFRRALWRELGGFDESLHANEDYDFNHRSRRRGRRVFLDPGISSTYYARPTLTALARQYFRYGWWKVQMLRKHPGSLRWRQAIPAGFVAALTLLGAAAFVVPAVRGPLAALLAVYGTTVAATALSLCAREGDWRRLPALCAAFVVVHLSWGTGFVTNLATGARWPYALSSGDRRVSPRSHS
jgi:cellulose synthase/poly-beta-1,6-N-acetylglucosamine synthase-like glycosyltransferase